MDVHARGKPELQIIFFQFFRCRFSYFIEKISIPGCSQKCLAGLGSCGDRTGLINADACVSICGHDSRNTIFGKAADAIGICYARVWHAAKKRDQVVIGELF